MAPRGHVRDREKSLSPRTRGFSCGRWPGVLYPVAQWSRDIDHEPLHSMPGTTRRASRLYERLGPSQTALTAPVWLGPTGRADRRRFFSAETGRPGPHRPCHEPHDRHDRGEPGAGPTGGESFSADPDRGGYAPGAAPPGTRGDSAQSRWPGPVPTAALGGRPPRTHRRTGAEGFYRSQCPTVASATPTGRTAGTASAIPASANLAEPDSPSTTCSTAVILWPTSARLAVVAARGGIHDGEST